MSVQCICTSITAIYACYHHYCFFFIFYFWRIFERDLPWALVPLKLSKFTRGSKIKCLPCSVFCVSAGFGVFAFTYLLFAVVMFLVKTTFRHLPFPLSVIIQLKIFVIKLNLLLDAILCERVCVCVWLETTRIVLFVLLSLYCRWYSSLIFTHIDSSHSHSLYIAAGTFQFTFVCIII